MNRRSWKASIALFGLVAAGSLASCSSTARLDPLPPAASSNYDLGVGDELRVVVYGLSDFSNKYTISDRGIIALPLIGNVPAQGRSVDEIQSEIEQRLTQQQILIKPIVSVQVEKFRPFFIVGEVKNPGQYPFQPGTSVLNAVSIAGGFTFRANTSKFAVTRRQGERSITGSASDQMLIQPGDTIRVFESWF